MDPVTIQLILALLPVAEKLIFSVGGKLFELDSQGVTKEELLKALEASRSETWPELKFISKIGDE